MIIKSFRSENTVINSTQISIRERRSYAKRHFNPTITTTTTMVVVRVVAKLNSSKWCNNSHQSNTPHHPRWSSKASSKIKVRHNNSSPATRNSSSTRSNSNSTWDDTKYEEKWEKCMIKGQRWSSKYIICAKVVIVCKKCEPQYYYAQRKP